MASALLHMSCPPLKNDIIGMDSLNDAFQGLERAKRDHDLDDLDRCQVKKRRKQSKPNRIASTESLSDSDVKSAVWVTLQQNQNSRPLKEVQSISQLETTYCETSKELKRDEQKVYSDAEESTEDNCSGMFNASFRKEFSFPLNLSHKTPSPQDSVDSFSSTLDERGWYKNPENASLLYNTSQNSDPINLKTQSYQNTLYQPSQACNIILPNFKKMLVGNNENQISSPHRIFNPEAFCDLCNKEFCNKYFLKTHKANKHGIYMENIAPNTMDNLSALPLMSYFSSSIANLSLSSNQQTKKISSNFSTSSNKSNSSMRAFCNICQREFCNKYFVRRHKAKIHGIIDNSGEPDYKPISHEKMDLLDSNLPGPSSFKLNKDYQANKDTLDISMDEEKTNVKKEDNDSEETDSPHDALSLLVSTWQNEESKDCSKSPDRNKKLPNSNNSAFCDICCKEYCNKYFLRVHKRKCHGILLPEIDERLKETGNMCKSNQPMPLNLILRENNKNQLETDNTYNCSICNSNFSDSYSLKLHHDQIHKVEKPNDRPLSSNSNKIFTPIDHQGIKPNIDLNNHRLVDSSNHIQQQENPSYLKKNTSSEVKKMSNMLLKLNQHIPFDNFICEVCSNDFGSMPALENHIIKDHAALIEEIGNSFYEENQNFLNNQLSKLECSKCQKQFLTLNLLEQHFAEKHSNSEPKGNIKFTNENQDMSSQLAVASERQIMHTPTSSFCEICKKELCNKYFMKTHMQRMHGISIENGAHIGGVVCDICNKELCSKYFLRVHKQNSHGIVEEAFLPQISSEIKVPVSNADIALRPNDNELSHRYFSHFTEVCTICNRRFRSAKWLRAHLLNDHGEEGKDKWREVQLQNGSKNDRSNTDSSKKDSLYIQQYKNYAPEMSASDVGPSTSDHNNDVLPTFLNRATPKQYHCTYCPFSSSVLALLLVHERTHLTPALDTQDLRCPVCSLPCENNDILEKHLALKHNSPAFCIKRTSEENNKFHDKPPVFQFDEIDNKRVPTTKDDNNYEETNDSKATMSPSTDACLKCNQCSFVTPHIEMYSEHVKNEHKLDEPQMDYLQVIRDALLQIANNSHIPASFAVPSNLGNFMMQPFVLEDKAFGANSPSTFLSSLVFLPVKERLNKPITASFKLTPT